MALTNNKNSPSAHRYFRRLQRLCQFLGLAGAAAILPIVFATAGLVLTDEEISRLTKKYGQSAAERLQNWKYILLSDKKLDETQKLEIVNRFFNKVRFVSDKEHWGKIDYWATPIEFLSTNGGDCEDFAIAKYLTLRELGVPNERLRITYVKALTLNQAHMVLTYYATAGAEPLVLDNLKEKILPASQRHDLVPVYSFNGDNLWLAKELAGRGQLVGGSDRIGLWNDMLERLKKEQETKP